MNINLSYINKFLIVAIGVLVLAGIGVWFFFFRSTNSLTTDTNTPTTFNDTTATSTSTLGSSDTQNTVGQTINTTAVATQNIFKINDGPIAGATLMQTLRPTTTIARYVRQTDGHVFDVPLGVSGAVPKKVSNITIPGGQRVLWVEGGKGAVMQYLDDALVVKTVYMGFPTATSSRAIGTTRLQFFPDNIIDIAIAPDGLNAAYLLKTSSGSDGYISKVDGSGVKKLFSLPFSQTTLIWPSQSNLIAYTNPAAGVRGVAFSVDSKSGAASLLLSGEGLSVAADFSFTNVLYQVVTKSSRNTLIHNLKSGGEKPLSFDPIPEKCTWSSITKSKVFCALPGTYTTTNFIDLWHQGAVAVDTIYSYDTAKGGSSQIASPGSSDGGVESDVLNITLSPDEKYLVYTTKGARSLWGVLLTQ